MCFWRMFSDITIPIITSFWHVLQLHRAIIMSSAYLIRVPDNDYHGLVSSIEVIQQNNMHKWWVARSPTYCIRVISDIRKLPSEEFELTANSLGAHIETHGGLFLGHSVTSQWTHKMTHIVSLLWAFHEFATHMVNLLCAIREITQWAHH